MKFHKAYFLSVFNINSFYSFLQNYKAAYTWNKKIRWEMKKI